MPNRRRRGNGREERARAAEGRSSGTVALDFGCVGARRDRSVHRPPRRVAVRSCRLWLGFGALVPIPLLALSLGSLVARGRQRFIAAPWKTVAPAPVTTVRGRLWLQNMAGDRSSGAIHDNWSRGGLCRMHLTVGTPSRCAAPDARSGSGGCASYQLNVKSGVPVDLHVSPARPRLSRRIVEVWVEVAHENRCWNAGR